MPEIYLYNIIVLDLTVLDMARISIFRNMFQQHFIVIEYEIEIRILILVLCYINSLWTVMESAEMNFK